MKEVGRISRSAEPEVGLVPCILENSVSPIFRNIGSDPPTPPRPRPWAPVAILVVVGAARAERGAGVARRNGSARRTAVSTCRTGYLGFDGKRWRSVSAATNPQVIHTCPFRMRWKYS